MIIYIDKSTDIEDDSLSQFAVSYIHLDISWHFYGMTHSCQGEKAPEAKRKRSKALTQGAPSHLAPLSCQKAQVDR